MLPLAPEKKGRQQPKKGAFSQRKNIQRESAARNAKRAKNSQKTVIPNVVRRHTEAGAYRAAGKTGGKPPETKPAPADSPQPARFAAARKKSGLKIMKTHKIEPALERLSRGGGQPA